MGPELAADMEASAAAPQPFWDQSSATFTGRNSLRARLKTLLTAGYDASVVRRVIILAVFIGPAFLANLLVYYFTARILPPENFGLFYVAVTIGNVAFSGSLVLNIFFTRYLSRFSESDLAGAIAAMRKIQRVVAFWGSLTAAAVFVLLIGLAKLLGTQSPLLIALIVIDTYVSYLADLGRAFLQSRRQVWRLGAYTSAWMGLRLLFCVLASASLGTVWAAMLGCAAGPAVIFIGFQILLAREAPRIRETGVSPVEPPTLPAFVALLPVTLGYGLLMIVSNLDILLIYFLLKHQDVGIYSASSVLPKGILVVTMPVSQMLFAVMTGDHKSDKAFRVVVRKTIWVIGSMAAAASLGVWALTPWVCGGSFGLKLCAPAPLHLLLLSTIALSLLRITVLLEFVLRRDWLILSLLFPACVYLLFAWYSKPTIDILALQFSIFSAASLVFFSAIQWAAPRWRGVESTQSAGT